MRLQTNLDTLREDSQKPFSPPIGARSLFLLDSESVRWILTYTRFFFKKPDTWGPPDEGVSFDHDTLGEVRLRVWHNLHAREDPHTPFSIILAETHLERNQPHLPYWLAYLGPETSLLQQRWQWYTHRWPIESSFCFRKQQLYWTLPSFHHLEACDRWTMLVTLAQWQLYLARQLVTDHPLPWQPPLQDLTPERVKQSLAGLSGTMAVTVAICMMPVARRCRTAVIRSPGSLKDANDRLVCEFL